MKSTELDTFFYYLEQPPTSLSDVVIPPLYRCQHPNFSLWVFFLENCNMRCTHLYTNHITLPVYIKEGGVRIQYNTLHAVYLTEMSIFVIQLSSFHQSWNFHILHIRMGLLHKVKYVQPLNYHFYQVARNCTLFHHDNFSVL